MKRTILSASVLCLFLTVAAAAQTEALLKSLVDLPAPAPRIWDVTEMTEEKVYPPEFFEESNVPPDNAPIEDLIAFWSHHVVGPEGEGGGGELTPSETVSRRLLEAVEKEPFLLPVLVNIFPAEPDFTRVIKRIYDQKEEELRKLEAAGEGDSAEIYRDVDINETAFRVIARANEEEEVTGTESLYSFRVVREWLVYNSDFYVGELLEKAEKVRDKDGYLTNQMELRALARVDWKKAEPILERLLADETQPVSATLAKWVYYARAIREEDDAGAGKYRAQLQSVVEDRTAPPGARDLALDALALEGDFAGRDDWYLSLLEDETLYELKVGEAVYSGLTTLITNSPPDKWIPKMIGLVGSRNRTVHNAAVRNLVAALNAENRDLMKVLLPWLADPNWARVLEDDRNKLISAFGRAGMPESIPGLITVIQNEEEYRMVAINALGNYKDPRVVPILLSQLPKSEDFYERHNIIQAIIETGGLNAAEQTGYLEAFARYFIASQPAGTTYSGYYSADDDLPVNAHIGLVLSRQEEHSDNLVRTVLLRIRSLQKNEPAVADMLKAIIADWKSPVFDLERLRAIGGGSADLETILRVLARRETIRENFRSDIYALRGKKGLAAGIAGCLLGDEAEMIALLNSPDLNEKIALLGCARLLRAPLAVGRVGHLLNSSEGLLALAAERYLIAEDGAEARRLVLARHPGEALILGSRFAFETGAGDFSNVGGLNELFESVNGFYPSSGGAGQIDKFQNKLREEFSRDKQLRGIYAFIVNGDSGHKVLRIYQDRTVYTSYEDMARYREKVLTEAERNAVFRFVAATRLEEQSAIIVGCHHGCPSREFVMLGPGGGRRIFVYSYMYPQPLAGLEILFNKIEAGKLELRYHLQDKISGLEVLLADADLEVRAVWKEGTDLRTLIVDKARQKRVESELAGIFEEEREAYQLANDPTDDGYYDGWRELNQRAYRRNNERYLEAFSWNALKDGKLQGQTFEPEGFYLPFQGASFGLVEGLNMPENVWNIRSDSFEIRTGDYSRQGLWRLGSDGRETRISEGQYQNPVISSDGNWVVATRAGYGESFMGLIRIDLRTGREHQVSIPNAPLPSPVTRIANGILLRNPAFGELPPYLLQQIEEKFGPDIRQTRKETEYLLLDPNTGGVRSVTGEFRPFEQITYRNLQPAGEAGKFWAAIYDEEQSLTRIGRYDAGRFKFEEVLKIPEISLSSMDIWVDEAAGKVYFVYEAHLLRLPLSPAPPG